MASIKERNGKYSVIYSYYDENGILTMNIYDFLTDERSLER